MAKKEAPAKVAAPEKAVAKAPAQEKAAAKSMTKAQIVDHLSEKLSVTKKMAADFIVEYANLAYKQAKKDFTLPGLGKLTVVSRKKRKGRNPATGQAITIPAKKVLKFKIAKACSDAVFPTK